LAERAGFELDLKEGYSVDVVIIITRRGAPNSADFPVLPPIAAETTPLSIIARRYEGDDLAIKQKRLILEEQRLGVGQPKLDHLPLDTSLLLPERAGILALSCRNGVRTPYRSVFIPRTLVFGIKHYGRLSSTHLRAIGR